MIANEKAMFQQLKANPDFLYEVAELMGDALCTLLIEIDGTDNFEAHNIIVQLARTRLDVRKLIID